MKLPSPVVNSLRRSPSLIFDKKIWRTIAVLSRYIEIPKNMPILASGLSDVKPRRPAEKPEITPKATLIQKITLNTKLELDILTI